jgi:hypothetical protein
MFNVVTDVEELISQAACMMRTVQQECEETYTRIRAMDILLDFRLLDKRPLSDYDLT